MVSGQHFSHSTQFSGGACPHSSKASGGENLEVEEPVAGWDCSFCHFHPALPGMLSTALLGDQVVQMGQPAPKRLLAPLGLMAAFHREQPPLKGVMGSLPQGAGHRQLRVGKHRILRCTPLSRQFETNIQIVC
jgi:hypothetical protein